MNRRPHDKKEKKSKMIETQRINPDKKKMKEEKITKILIKRKENVFIFLLGTIDTVFLF